MTTSLGTSTLSMYITMGEPVELESLTKVSSRFTNIYSLLVVSSLLVQAENMRPSSLRPGEPSSFTRESIDTARATAQSFRVARVRYESPWQLLLQYGHDYGHYIVGGGGVAGLYGVAVSAQKLFNRAVDTRERFWKSNEKVAESKKKIAQSELAETGFKAEKELAERDLADAIKAQDKAVFEESINLHETLSIKVPANTEHSVLQAAEALLAITNIELEGEAEPA